MVKLYEGLYRVRDGQPQDAKFFNDPLLSIDGRLHVLEERDADLKEQVAALVADMRERIDGALLPAYEKVQTYQSGGFLTAPIIDAMEVPFVEGAGGLVVHEENRAIFRPSPFIVLMRASTPDDYAIAQALGYDEETGILSYDIVSATDDPGPFGDIIIASTTGAALAQIQYLAAARAARDAAQEARDLAAAWAEKPDGEAVTAPSTRSAKHHAGVAAGHAGTASGAAGVATGAAGVATGAAGVATGKAQEAADHAAAAALFDPSSYYVKTAIDAALADKSDIGHSHAIAEIPGLQTALDNIPLLQTAVAEIPTLRSNLMLQAFRLAMAGDLSIQAAVDGFYDTFSDTAGLDLAGSTNHAFDADRLLVAPVRGLYSASNPGGSGDRRSMIAVSSNLTLSSGTLAATVDGNTATLGFQASDTDTNGKWVQFDFGAPVDIGQASAISGAAPARGSFLLQASHDATAWVDLRSGGTTWNATPYAFSTNQNTGRYRYYRIIGTSVAAWGSAQTREFEFLVYAHQNMSLRSVAVAARAQPSVATLYMLKRDFLNDGFTLNTDLIGEVSRDGGTSWTAVALAEQAVTDGERLLSGSASLAGQPSGTAMRWRVRTANNKDAGVSAVGLTWR